MNVFYLAFRLDRKYPRMLEAFIKQFHEFIENFEESTPMLFREQRNNKEYKVAISISEDTCQKLIFDKMVASVIYLLYFSGEKFNLDFTYIVEEQLSTITPDEVMEYCKQSMQNKQEHIHVRSLGHQKTEVLYSCIGEIFWETVNETYDKLQVVMKNRLVSASMEPGVDELDLFKEVHRIYVSQVLKLASREE